jgi:hypothetical protein
MPDAPVPSLARAREAKIDELSNFFANDDLTLEDLERRIESVYKAASVTELETITADLKLATVRPDEYTRAKLARATPSLPQSYDAEYARILSIMSSTRRAGRWVVPRKLDVVAIMTDAKIDITHALLPPGIIELDMRVIMASFKLVVPPNVRVINESHAFLASVRSRADELRPDGEASSPNETVIRLTGTAIMADVNIVVRRREDPVYDDDDEDDD